MTPEGRQQVAVLIARINDWMGTPRHPEARDKQEAILLLDDTRGLLALLLAEAPQNCTCPPPTYPHEEHEPNCPKAQEQKEAARVDAMGDSKDNRTAAPDVAEGDRLTTPTHVNNEALYRQWLIDQREGSQNPERWETYDDALHAFDVMITADATAPVTPNEDQT